MDYTEKNVYMARYYENLLRTFPSSAAVRFTPAKIEVEEGELEVIEIEEFLIMLMEYPWDTIDGLNLPFNFP